MKDKSEKMKKTVYFSDIVRRLFIVYAITPAFCIVFLCLVIVMGVWQFTVRVASQDAITKVGSAMESAVGAYSEKLQALSKEETLLEDVARIDRQVEVYGMLYQLHLTTGYKGQLYILDGQLNEVFGSGEEPGFLVDNTTANWGILREVRLQSDRVSYQLVNDEKKLLCVGTGIPGENGPAGYIVATFEAKEFERLLTQVSPDMIVTDANGWVFVTNHYGFQDPLDRLTHDIMQASGFIEHLGNTYFLSQGRVLDNTFRIYSVTSFDIESEMFRIMGVFTLFIFAATISITYFTSRKVANASTKDIHKIAEAFERAKKGDLEHYLDIDSCVEFQEIGEAYNLMLDGLKTNMRENQQLSQLAAFAQVKQLEAQFNPHFLFNTLDNIRFMSKIDPEATDKMIIALSNLLRYSIKDAQEEVQVEEDIQYTESYLTILKIRYNRRLTYSIEIEDRVRRCRIPKFLLQTIIENAVKYGYADKETLHVSIRGFQRGNDLIFICEDNGSGISEAMLRQIRANLQMPFNNKEHHGLYNIHHRIRLMYHGDYGVSLESRLGEGTTVTLRLPFRVGSGD